MTKIIIGIVVVAVIGLGVFLIFNKGKDEGAIVSVESALDLVSLEQEASAIDFSGDLNIFNESLLQELDQAFGEILQ